MDFHKRAKGLDDENLAQSIEQTNPGKRKWPAPAFFNRSERERIAKVFPAVKTIQQGSQRNQDDGQRFRDEADNLFHETWPGKIARYPEFVKKRKNQEDASRARQRGQRAQTAGQ